MGNPAKRSWRQWVDDPQSRKIVITLTCVLALLALWYAADEYSAVRNDRAQLVELIGETQRQVSRLEYLEQRAAEQAQTTGKLEQRTVPEERVHEFRNLLSDLTRRSGCRIQKIELAEPRRRPWREGDHPLEIKPVSKKVAETPYQLRSQRVSLVLAGPLNSIYELLGQLRATDKAIHTQRFNLRPVDSHRQEAILELELILFDLEMPKPAESV